MIDNNTNLGILNDQRENLIHSVLSADLDENAIIQIIKYLYNNCVSPDKPNLYNVTPLHIACSNQYNKIIEYLIKINRNTNYTDKKLNTSLNYLIKGFIKRKELHNNKIMTTEMKSNHIMNILPDNINNTKIKFTKYIYK